jgi:PAS domain-containing protein
VTAQQDIYVGFRHILDAISDGVYVTGPDRTVVYWSAGAERITGYSADEVVGRRCDEDLLAHTDLDGARICLSGCPLQDCLETGQAMYAAKNSGRDGFAATATGDRR